MNPLPPKIRARLLLRSFSVQASWNYQSLIGTGFAFLLLPELRRLYGGDRSALSEATARHAELFNSHPYLVTVAAGAVLRMEEEGAAPEAISRFKSALRGSLGTIGDRLVWQAWRPATALLAIVLLLVGLPWWAAVGAFLLAYNLLHLWLRAWGLEVGLREGLGVGKALREAPFQRLGSIASMAGALLAGAAAALAFGAWFIAADTEIGRSLQGAGWILGSVAAMAGLWFGLRIRAVATVLLFLVWLLDLVLALNA